MTVNASAARATKSRSRVRTNLVIWLNPKGNVYYLYAFNVEYVGDGFKILEVLDDELMEYAWNIYIWNNEQNKYIKQ